MFLKTENLNSHWPHIYFILFSDESFKHSLSLSSNISLSFSKGFHVNTDVLLVNIGLSREYTHLFIQVLSINNHMFHFAFNNLTILPQKDVQFEILVLVLMYSQVSLLHALYRKSMFIIIV